MDRLSEPLLSKCWKETGVYGDRTCPRLGGLGHCRHCDVYATAGRRRLDREIPPGAREEWTLLLSRKKETTEIGSTSVIVFRLRDEWLALKTMYFQEATAPAVCHTLPGRTNKVLKGIVNVNGELILCVSVADLLDLTDNTVSETAAQSEQQAAPGTIYPRLVVVVRDGARYAFPAEEVLGVHRLDDDDLQDLPATLSKSARALTKGLFTLEGRTVGFLDEDKLFQSLARSLAA